MGWGLLDQHKSSGGSPELAIIDFLVLIYPAKIPENIPELEFEKYTLQKSTQVYSIFLNSPVQILTLWKMLMQSWVEIGPLEQWSAT